MRALRLLPIRRSGGALLFDQLCGVDLDGKSKDVARVYATPEKKQVLGLHTQVCQSLIDQRDLGPGFR